VLFLFYFVANYVRGILNEKTIQLMLVGYMVMKMVIYPLTSTVHSWNDIVKVTSHLRGSLSGSSEKKFVRALVSIKA